MDLSVIVPNYNGENLLPALIPQLETELETCNHSYEIIVSDDCSTDGSVRLVRDAYPSVRVVAGDNRLGYGGNCNRGAKEASGEILAFVNSDIRLGKDVFAPLARVLSEEGVFAVMPLVYAEGLGRTENLNFLWKNRGLVWLKPVGGVPHEDPVKVSEKYRGGLVRDVPLCGAFFLCRRRVFEKLEGFNPIFSPAYWEDVDLGFRAKRLGFETCLATEVRVSHLHSKTINTLYSDAKKSALLLKNQAIFMRLHLDQLAPIPHFRFWLALRIPQRLLQRRFFLIPLYGSLVFARTRIGSVTRG